jgi:hypothetical protein
MSTAKLDVWPADGGGRWVVKARTMMERSWPPGSADVPVGSHFELVADGDVSAPRYYAAHEVGPRDGGPLCVGGWRWATGVGVAIGLGIERTLDGIRT